MTSGLAVWKVGKSWGTRGYLNTRSAEQTLVDCVVPRETLEETASTDLKYPIRCSGNREMLLDVGVDTALYSARVCDIP